MDKGYLSKGSEYSCYRFPPVAGWVGDLTLQKGCWIGIISSMSKSGYKQGAIE
jgi:hypothetical protein